MDEFHGLYSSRKGGTVHRPAGQFRTWPVGHHLRTRHNAPVRRAVKGWLGFVTMRHSDDHISLYVPLLDTAVRLDDLLSGWARSIAGLTFCTGWVEKCL
jgi:hypothetical protein